jgi:predicted transcriptional regulator
MNTKLLSFVLRAKNRRNVLFLLAKEKLTPAQITKRIGMYESHTSRTLKELSHKKLILCENPADRRFRFYAITPLGKKFVKEAQKILKEVKGG